MSRRQIVRRSLAVTAGGMLAANARVGASAWQEGSPVADATPATEAAITLDLRGGDVWAWEKRLTGVCPGCPPEATLVLRVNDETVPAERDGDTFAATVKLQPGKNRVVAAAAMADGSVEESAAVTHNVRLAPRPTARIVLSIEGERIGLDGSGSEPSAFDGAAIASYQWEARAGNPESTWFGSGDGPRAQTPAPTTDGEYYLSLTVEDGEGRTDTATSYFVVENGKARTVDPLVEEAVWTAPAVVYGVITRNFEGGNFQGVIDRLDDLHDLGVAALWFAPITRTIPDYFGYEVKDYFTVRETYGTNDDFHRLVEEAHARGIRVLVDFVPNHTSIEHPYYEDAAEHGTSSQYYDFYDRDDGGNSTHYFDWTHLPNLNFDNPDVRTFMTEAFSYWVREHGVDGFRADVAWGIKERNPDYWLECSAELNRIKPNCLLIAEASARDSYYVQNGFDAAYDWTDELGHWAWGDAFAAVAPMSQAMREVLTNDGDGYPPDSFVFRFLNNNDTGARFISSYGVDFYRVAAAMLLTLPGLPCIYTGDEVGAEFQPYGQIGPIEWSDTHGLRDDFKRLIALRREQPSLHSRAWMPLEVEPAAALFGYLRHGAEGDPPVVVLLNYSREIVEATVPFPTEYEGMLLGGALSDLWTDESIAVSAPGPITVSMPAWGIRILVAVAA